MQLLDYLSTGKAAANRSYFAAGAAAEISLPAPLQLGTTTEQGHRAAASDLDALFFYRCKAEESTHLDTGSPKNHLADRSIRIFDFPILVPARAAAFCSTTAAVWRLCQLGTRIAHPGGGGERAGI